MRSIRALERVLVCGLVVAACCCASQGQTILHVDADRPAGGDGASWATAYRHLTDALSAAAAIPAPRDVEIWVAEGTYMPDGGFINDQGFTQGTGDRNAGFAILDGVSMVGSFVGNEASVDDRPDLFALGIDRPRPTSALSGNLANNFENPFVGQGLDENSLHVLTTTGSGPGSATFDGLDIVSGNADVTGNDDDSGGGIRVLGIGFEINLRACRIAGNQCAQLGGGLFTRGVFRLRNCEFNANATTLGDGGHVFADNAGFAVFCAFVNGRARLDNESLPGGNGAALALQTGGPFQFQNSRFIDNVAQDWGGVLWANAAGPSSPFSIVFQNCLMDANLANSQGGSFWVGDAILRIINCTLVDNASEVGSVGYLAAPGSSQVFVDNSLFSGNIPIQMGQSVFWGANDTLIDIATTLRDESSFILGFGGASTVIDGSILEPALGLKSDFSLSAASPAIDAGQSAMYSNNPPEAPELQYGLDEFDIDENGLMAEALPRDLTAADRFIDVPGMGSDAIDIGAYEWNSPAITQARLYVDADAPAGGDGGSWQTAFRHLNEALAIPQTLPQLTPIEIWVAEGTYMPDGGYINDQGFTPGSGDITATFELIDGIEIYGSFIGSEDSIDLRPSLGPLDHPVPTTILSGNLSDNLENVNSGEGFADNSMNVCIIDTGTTGAGRLDGISIVRGNGQGPALANESRGGAIRHLSDTFELAIENCSFRENRAHAGGATFNLGPMTVENSVFEGNVAWGGGSVGIGGAMSIFGNLLVANCLFFENRSFNNTSRGGAVNVSPSSGRFHQFQCCRFIANDAARGGAVYIRNSPDAPVLTRFQNCLFNGNGASASLGGAFYAWRGNLRLYSCTVTRNGGPSTTTGGVVYAELNSGVRLRSTILSDNLGSGAWLAGDAPIGPVLRIFDSMWDRSSGIIGGWQESSTAGSTDVPDFLFVDPAGVDGVLGTLDDDYTPGQGSPAIDAGNGGSNNEYSNPTGDPLTGHGEDYLDIDNDGFTQEILPGDVDLSIRFVDVVGVNDPGDPLDVGCYEVQTCTDCPGERRFVNASGGQFETGLNWFPGAPGIGNTAVFDIAQTYTIDLNAPADNFALRARDGDVTLDLNANTYSLNSAVETGVIVGESQGDNASVTIRGGNLLSENGEIGRFAGATGSMTLDTPGTLWFLQEDLTVGLAGAGALDISGGALVDALQTTIGASASGSGAVTVSGAGSRLDSLFLVSVENGSLDVSSGGEVRAGQAILGGVLLFDNGSLTGDGTITGNVFNFGDVFGARTPPGGDTQDGALGDVVGGLTIAFDYEQLGTIQGRGEASGTLGVQIDPSSGATDALTVLGTASLAGGLIVEPTGAIAEAQVGTLDGSTVMTAGTLSGRFDVALMPGLPPNASGTGRFLRVSYSQGLGDGDLLDRGLVSVTLVVETLGDEINVDPEQNFSVDGSPVGAATGDFGDGQGGGPDGFVDLAVIVPDDVDPVANPGSVVVLFNAGTSNGNWLGFTAGTAQFPVGRDPSAIGVADIDNDSVLDLAITNRADDMLLILAGDGTGGFSPIAMEPVGDAPSALAIGTLDLGFEPDIAVANEEDDTVSVFVNGGGSGGLWSGLSLTATLLVGDAPAAIGILNADDDKWDDLVTGDRKDNRISVIANLGGASFAPAFDLAVGPSPVDVLVEDLDLDGLPDIATVSETAGSVSILRNTSTGGGDFSFAPAVDLPVGAGAFSLTGVDLDSDGDIDLPVVAGPGTGTNVVAVLRNDLFAGDLIFALDADLPTGPDPRFVINDDVDNADGSDVLTINAGSALFADGARGVPTVLEAVSVIPQTAPCLGDANGDGPVNFGDITTVLGQWLTDGSGGGDANRDGIVNFGDLTTVLSNWLSICP